MVVRGVVVTVVMMVVRVRMEVQKCLEEGFTSRRSRSRGDDVESHAHGPCRRPGRMGGRVESDSRPGAVGDFS